MIRANSESQHDNTHTSKHNTLPLWQKPILKIVVALISVVTILVVMNMTIARYETHLATGEVVLLKLAPVDPRGFMQGDFMRLRFAMGDEIRSALAAHYESDNNELSPRRGDTLPQSLDGIAIINKDAHNVGHLVRLVDMDKVATWNNSMLGDDEMPLYFRVRDGQVKFATNAFFFQEGHAKAYEVAEYGMFRVNDKGEPLLTHMVDGAFEVIEAQSNDTIENIE